MVSIWSVHQYTNLSLSSQDNCPHSLVLPGPGDVLSDLLHHVQGERIPSLGVGQGDVLHPSLSPHSGECVRAETSPTKDTAPEGTDTAGDMLEQTDTAVLHVAEEQSEV